MQQTFWECRFGGEKHVNYKKNLNCDLNNVNQIFNLNALFFLYKFGGKITKFGGKSKKNVEFHRAHGVCFFFQVFNTVMSVTFREALRITMESLTAVIPGWSCILSWLLVLLIRALVEMGIQEPLACWDLALLVVCFCSS